MDKNETYVYLEDHFLVLELFRQQLCLAGAGQTQDIAYILVLLVHVGAHGVATVDEGLHRVRVCDYAQVLTAVSLHNHEVAGLQRGDVSRPQSEVANGLLELHLSK